MLEENGKAVRILMNLLNGLNRSVPHIDVMSIIFDILVSLAEFKDTRSNLAKLDIVYDSVIVAMGKGEKNSEVFGKGCSLFWRLATEVEGRSKLKSKPQHKFKCHNHNSLKAKNKPQRGRSAPPVVARAQA